MSTLYESLLKYKHLEIPALYFYGKKITYKEFFSNVNKLITYLQSHGIKKDDVITVCLPNVPLAVYLIYALDAIGAIQNIIHPLSSISQIEELMIETKSKSAIVLETLYEEDVDHFKNTNFTYYFVNPVYDISKFLRKSFYIKHKRAPENTKLYSLDKYRDYEECVSFVFKDGKEPSIYLHSGGTTGIPKSIVLCDDAINTLAKKVSSIITEPLTDKVMLAVLPTFHGFGLGMGIHTPLYNGAAVNLMIKFDSNLVIKEINKNRIHYIIGVPALFSKLKENKRFSKCNLKHLSYCFVGGDNVNVDLLNNFNEYLEKHGSKCKLLEGYGLTETFTVCTVNTKENCKVGSVGKPLDGIEIQIRDSDLDLLGRNHIGEVFISGDTLMNEYLNNPETTKEVMLNIDGKNWIRTGDIGYLDDDNFLYLKGRKKRLIKIGGVNVFPAEIEKFVEMDPCIDKAAVAFFETPTPHTNLYLMLSKKVDELELVKKIKEDITNKFLKYSVPENILIVDDFPYTKVGKIDYTRFKDIAR